jgi:hypothetical protein
LACVQRTFSGSGEVVPGQQREVLILGVTPGYAHVKWDAGTKLTALDGSPEMVRCVWPATSATSAQALCGDWLDPPLPPQSVDAVVGDGSLSQLAFPAGYERLASALTRVSRADACWSLRLFCRPPRCESADAVISDLVSGRTRNFHAFKLRLAMALHGENDEGGVRVADVWTFWNEAHVNVQRLIGDGIPRDVIGMIDSYRNSPVVYSFPPLESVIATIQPYAELQLTFNPQSYELAERCPTLAFRCRG